MASCAKEQGLRGGLLDALLRALAVVRVELRLVVCIAGVLPVLPLLLANGRVGDQADGHGPGVRANLELQPLVCLPAIFQLVRGIKTVARIPAKQRSARLSPCSIAARLSAAADCLFLTHLLVCWGSQPDLSEVPQQEHSSSSMHAFSYGHGSPQQMLLKLKPKPHTGFPGRLHRSQAVMCAPSQGGFV